MFQNNKKAAFLDYLMIIVGTALMATAINSVFDMSGMVTGGFSGIAILVKEWTEGVVPGGIPLWITNLSLNIPLFLIGMKLSGFQFVKRALVGEICLSFWLAVLPAFDIAGNDLLLAAVYGGVIQGIGIGLVFLGRGTTGGTDMMAALLQRKLRHYSIAQIMQVLDGMVVLAGAAVFGVQYALYALIAIFCVSKISDGILDGMKFSKQAFIISDHYQEIANAIMTRMERGVTSLDGNGMYSGQERKILFCVVAPKEIVKIREIVREFDPGAFVIVSDVREVFGEGFIEY